MRTLAGFARSGAAVVARLAVGLCACLGLAGCVIYLNPLCTDQIKNGDETGVDCGGGCGRCNIGEGCRVAADCDGGNCQGGVCKAPPCEDGMKSEAETDVDCGGGTCRKCAGGRTCLVDDDCFSGTCTPGPHTCSSLASVSFATEDRYPSGFKAYAMFPGDLDGDGDIDLAVANEYGSSVSVFLNDYSTGGAFRHLNNPAGRPPDEPSLANFGPTGAYPTGGAVVDLDGDGHLDVVTADYHGNSVTVLLNGGTGLLNKAAVASYRTASGAETSNLAVGDLDGDGQPDVVATNPQAHSISVFLNQGGGVLSSASDVPVGVGGGSQPYSVAIADFNGDGKNDLAVAEEVSGAIIVRLGNGDGTFQTEVPYGINGTRDYIIIAADVNKDGIVDLVSANRGSDDVSVLLGRGDGTFRKAIVTSVLPGMGPYSIAVTDINVDGVPDLVTPNFMTDSVTILLGIGDGHFQAAMTTTFMKPIGTQLPDTTPYGIVSGDFNHDGKPDIATANAGSYDVTVKLNTSH